MGTDYRIMCKECDTISERAIGSCYRPYHDASDIIISFLKKHWHCELSGLRIVDETYGICDCRIDDCKPGTIPTWDKIITLTDKGLEEENVYQNKFKERMGK
jgi:hypothetical protein